jgi:hypothetical protein
VRVLPCRALLAVLAQGGPDTLRGCADVANITLYGEQSACDRSLAAYLAITVGSSSPAAR